MWVLLRMVNWERKFLHEKGMNVRSSLSSSMKSSGPPVWYRDSVRYKEPTSRSPVVVNTSAVIRRVGICNSSTGHPPAAVDFRGEYGARDDTGQT